MATKKYAVFYGKILTKNYRTGKEIYDTLSEAYKYAREMTEIGNGQYFVSEVKIKQIKGIKK